MECQVAYDNKKKKNKIKPLGKIVVHCITREQARHSFFVRSLSFFFYFFPVSLFSFLCSSSLSVEERNVLWTVKSITIRWRG